MGSQPHPHTWERRSHTLPKTWGDGITDHTDTSRKKGSHTTPKHTWGDGITTTSTHLGKEIIHHTEDPGETGSQIIPTHLERRDGTLTTHHTDTRLERGGHTYPHRYTWKEGITHHTDTLGHRYTWGYRITHHAETPVEGRSYIYLPIRRDGITHHNETSGKRRSYTTPILTWGDGITTTLTHLGKGDHTPYQRSWGDGITDYTDTPGKKG